MPRPWRLVILAPVFCLLTPCFAQTGFPFTDEALHYSINWPSGLSLGDANFDAHRTGPGWDFSLTINAGVPGFNVADHYRSATAGSDFCSLELERDTSHAGHTSREKTTFDQKNQSAKRVTLQPEGGGKSEFEIPTCARDALAFVYFVRREMGQGRVAPPQTVFFGASYNVRIDYTGAQTIPSDNKMVVTDHVNVSVKGPSVDTRFEIYFARDAARTPLLIRVPLSVGTISAELVR